ncbi:protein FAM71D [Alligator mississippiensis]|uniref:Protein FAM71D n=1 Tax=Alligator mississippiensis TaxID=8496 RepID=A0A151P1C2_ALLMI|nr:protein FAM71D [Alligator mississippiensis]
MTCVGGYRWFPMRFLVSPQPLGFWHQSRSCRASRADPVTDPPTRPTEKARIPLREDLQRHLREGEYSPFQTVAMFESNFIQVTRRGKNVDIHNHQNEAIIGIVSTNNKLPLPDIMLIAHPVPMLQSGQVSSGHYAEQVALTRLLPLQFVRISVYNFNQQSIKIKLINGRSYYLQLYAPPEEQEPLFDRWVSLIYLLHHPPAYYLRPRSFLSRDFLRVKSLPSEEEEKEVMPGSWEKAPADTSPAKEEEEEEEDKSQDSSCENYSRTSIAQGPSTETKEPLAEAKGLRELDTTGKEGDLEEEADDYFFPSSTALSRTRESTLVSSTKDPKAKKLSTRMLVRERSSSLEIKTLFSNISKILHRSSSEEEKGQADHG